MTIAPTAPQPGAFPPPGSFPPPPDLTPLTDAGREMRDRVRALIPLIRRDAQAAEESGRLTPEVLTALDDAGVYRMMMPHEWGGTALPARDLVEVIATIAEADGSAAWSAFVAVGIRNLLAFHPDVVAEVAETATSWTGPVAVGASVFSPNVGDARRVDGGWMVKGFWPFGSGSHHAHWAVVGVAYDPAFGSGRGMVVLERDQFEIVDDWKVMGLSGSSSNSLRVAEEIFVPDHRFSDIVEFPARMNAVRASYTGAAFQQGGLAIMLVAALSNIAIALGMARGALGCFAEQAPAKKPFNLPYPSVAEMPSTQVALGRAQAMVNLAGAAITGVADLIDARTALGIDFTPDEESESTLTLAYAANVCADAIDLLQKTLGSSTVALSNPIQRFARDARVMITHGAIRVDPIAEINGRRLLGIPPFPMIGMVLPARDE